MIFFSKLSVIVDIGYYFLIPGFVPSNFSTLHVKNEIHLVSYFWHVALKLGVCSKPP